MRRYFLTLATAAALLSVPPTVRAVVVQYYFTGSVSSVTPNLSPAVQVSDAFSATLTFDTNGFTTANNYGVQSDYVYSGTPSTAFLLDAQVGSVVGSRSSGQVSILNDFNPSPPNFPNGQDWFQALAGNTSQPFKPSAINGLNWNQTTLTLKDYQASLYSDTSLPNQIAQLNAFEEAFVTLFFQSSGLIQVQITSIEAVLSNTNAATLQPGVPTPVIPGAQAGGLQATLAEGTDGTFSATYSQQAASEVDLSSFNFFIPGAIFQAWDLSFGGTVDSFVDLVFKYDDTGMTPIEENFLAIWHQIGPDQFVRLPGIVDINNNTITTQTSTFSPFILGSSDGTVPEPGTLALLGLGLAGLAAARRRKQ